MSAGSTGKMTQKNPFGKEGPNPFGKEGFGLSPVQLCFATPGCTHSTDQGRISSFPGNSWHQPNSPRFLLLFSLGNTSGKRGGWISKNSAYNFLPRKVIWDITNGDPKVLCSYSSWGNSLGRMLQNKASFSNLLTPFYSLGFHCLHF